MLKKSCIMSKYIFVLAPTHSQPRFHKRVDQISHHGDIIIFYFSRNLYKQNKFNKKYKQVNLGEIEDRKYYKRFSSYVSAFCTIRKYAAIYKPDRFYSFSIDLSIIAMTVGIKQGYLEIGDFILSKGIGRFSRLIEYYLFNKLDGIVFTSDAFRYNYKRWHVTKTNKLHTIDNKMSPIFSSKDRGIEKEINSPVVIGLIGLLRYEEPIKKLVSFVNNTDNVKILCYGDGPMKKFIENQQNDRINYCGSYKNPSDLETIYNNIDINFVVYDNTINNVRLAIPNKLYESIFWGKPIIVADETYLSTKVNEFQVGGVISINCQNSFNNTMAKYCTIDWINTKVQNCFIIDRDSLIDNNNTVFNLLFR